MFRRHFFIALLFFELFLIFQFASRIVSILQTDSRIQNTRVQRNLLRKEFESKMFVYSYVKTDLYVEEIAHAKLRYGYPGEHVYIINESKVALPSLPPVVLSHQEKTAWCGEVVNWYTLFFK